MDLDSQQSSFATYLGALQERITQALELVDGSARFRNDRWERPGGGGGNTRVLEGGTVFEKAAVNVSDVHGDLDSAFAAQLAGEGRAFRATGLSLVLHPRSPAVPTVHANFRMIVQGSSAWFGGGSDLTPYLLFEEDCRHFHAVWKAACDAHDREHYARFKAWCDTYFHLPHREEHRGIGGIFFDTLGAGEPGALAMHDPFVRTCGDSFLPAYLPIVERRKDLPTTEEDRAWQLMRRGRYVEFNLVYDRGTTFGLKTRGRTESILVSLPPVVTFPYSPEPPNDRARALLEVLRTPRDWV